MNSQQFFQMLDVIDDEYILEANENIIPNLKLKVAATVAAVAIVSLSAIWFSNQMLNRTDQHNVTQDLTEQTVPSELPSPRLETPEPMRTEPPVAIETLIPTPIPTESHSGPDEGEIDMAAHEPPYRAEYVHTDEGDYIIFTSVLFDQLPQVTLDITGQIVDGHYAATIPGLLAANQRYVELQIYDDGSYDLYWEHDPFNDTEWWLNSKP